MSRDFHAAAVARTWRIMTGMTACFVWPFAIIVGGPGRWSGFLRLIGIGARYPAGVQAWGLAAFVVVVFCWLSMRGYPLIRAHVLDVTSQPALKALGVVFGTVAAVVEEVWFRRIPMDWAAGRGASALAQVAFAAMLFALPHGVWGIAARSMRVFVGSIVATACLGAALATVYLAGGRVLAPCIWAHVAINVILEPWLFLAAMTRGLEHGRTFPSTSSGREDHAATASSR